MTGGLLVLGLGITGGLLFGIVPGMTEGLHVAGTRHDRRGVFWYELDKAGGFLVAETRHDRRAACS
jgi:hypothetical protein